MQYIVVWCVYYIYIYKQHTYISYTHSGSYQFVCHGQSVPVPWTVSKNDNRWCWHGSLGVSVMCHGAFWQTFDGYLAMCYWCFWFPWFYDCKFSCDRHRPHRRNTCSHGSTTCTTAAGETCPFNGPSMVPCLWWFSRDFWFYSLVKCKQTCSITNELWL